MTAPSSSRDRAVLDAFSAVRETPGAQQDSCGGGGGGSDRRRGCGDPGDQPAACRRPCASRWSPAPAGSDCRGGCRPAVAARPPDAPTGIAVTAADAPTSPRRRLFSHQYRRTGRKRVGIRRVAVGDVPAPGLVPQDDEAEEPVPLRRRRLLPRRTMGPLRRPAPGRCWSSRPTTTTPWGAPGAALVPPAGAVSIAAALAAVTVGGLAIKLTNTDSTPTTTTTW